MESNTSPPPPSYWTPPSNSTGMPHHRRPSPPILSPPVLIILLPIITFLFLLFAIPPFLSFTSHIFRPIAVKRSWDLLNIFLVLFAILCGIFARRNDDESANNDVDSNVVPNLNGSGGGEPEPVNPQRWFGFSDEQRSEKIYGDVCRTAEGGALRRLSRSSSSYPDLRQESLWETRDDQRFQFRFFDDFEINKYRATAPYDPSREAGARRIEAGDGEAKEIPVDTFVVRPTPPPNSLSPFPSPSPSPSPATPPPPPPPPPVDRHKPTRTYQAVGERKEKAEKKHEDSNDVEIDQFPKVRSPPPTPPPPPPLPPPSPARIRPEQKYVKLERRKSKVKKEIAMALTSLYSQRKRKKKQKIDRDSATSSPPEQTRFPPPSPPPPPPPLPPPPSSVFHNLFKKGSKNKRSHTVPPPPPPPPPPISSSPPTLSRSSKHKNRSKPPPAPPTPPLFSSSLRPSKHKNRSAPPPPPPLGPPTPPPPQATERSRSGGRPPLSGRSVSYYEKNVNSGSQSPPIPMPPPPPPPPFKLSEFKFVVRGDYVRIRSSQSSRCSSPELDDVDASSTKVEPEIVNVMDGGDGPVAGSVSCPSPDVNVKADTFIARLYDGWRLEKINSLREKGKT